MEIEARVGVTGPLADARYVRAVSEVADFLLQTKSSGQFVRLKVGPIELEPTQTATTKFPNLYSILGGLATTTNMYRWDFR